ncbi:ABC transporter ATP-binding protein [Patescibacteria group bacterium]
MLHTQDLQSGYGKMHVLHGIDFMIKSGEIIAIIGPNGSGKSTFLKSIFGLCDIYSGNIIWMNKNITKLKTYEKISEGIAYVPQGRQIFRNLTTHENLEIGTYSIKDRRLAKKRIKTVYEKFPYLRDKRDKIADTLSGGQQQILSIGRALILNPQLLLVDEPSLGLSPKATKMVFKKIQELNKEGVSVIIVEQNIKAATEIANQIYVFENGRVVLKGQKDILKNPMIKNVYFGGK